MAETEIRIKDIIPLALLYSAESNQIEGRTRLQKLVFLAQDDLEDEGVDTLEYVPYKYGPFSKSLIEAIERFQQMGLLERSKQRTYGGSEKYVYNLTPKGNRTFQHNLEGDDNAEIFEKILDVAQDTLNKHNKKSLDKLINEVYEEHPEYATESVY